MWKVGKRGGVCSLRWLFIREGNCLTLSSSQWWWENVGGMYKIFNRLVDRLKQACFSLLAKYRHFRSGCGPKTYFLDHFIVIMGLLKHLFSRLSMVRRSISLCHFYCDPLSLSLSVSISLFLSLSFDSGPWCICSIFTNLVMLLSFITGNFHYDKRKNR